MKQLLSLIAAAFFLMGAAASASDRVGSVAEFLDALDQVRADLEDGVPKPLSTREWRLYDDAETEMRTILEGITSIDDLGDDARVALFNAQERIEAILKGAEDERLVCRRERRTGSNIRKATCVTVAQLQQEQEAAKRSLRMISHNGESFRHPEGGN